VDPSWVGARPTVSAAQADIPGPAAGSMEDLGNGPIVQSVLGLANRRYGPGMKHATWRLYREIGHFWRQGGADRQVRTPLSPPPGGMHSG